MNGDYTFESTALEVPAGVISTKLAFWGELADVAA
jgi:hypothetical protein